MIACKLDSSCDSASSIRSFEPFSFCLYLILAWTRKEATFQLSASKPALYRLVEVLDYRKDSIKPPPIRWFLTNKPPASNKPPWGFRVFSIMQVKNKRKSHIQLFICLFGLIFDLNNCLHSFPLLDAISIYI